MCVAVGSAALIHVVGFSPVLIHVAAQEYCTDACSGLMYVQCCKWPCILCSMVWYGMVWYGMVWYGMVWYVVVVVVEGTQHVPAGEIARHALPGQGAREQSAGVTLAGRVPTTTEGGGGVPPSVWGGRGRASL